VVQTVDEDVVTSAAAGDGEEAELFAAAETEVDTSVKHESGNVTSGSGLPLTAVRSASSEWTDEEMLLDWTQQLTVRQLQLLRDFFVEGMNVNVVEHKVDVTLTSSQQTVQCSVSL